MVELTKFIDDIQQYQDREYKMLQAEFERIEQLIAENKVKAKTSAKKPIKSKSAKRPKGSKLQDETSSKSKLTAKKSNEGELIASIGSILLAEVSHQCKLTAKTSDELSKFIDDIEEYKDAKYKLQLQAEFELIESTIAKTFDKLSTDDQNVMDDEQAHDAEYLVEGAQVVETQRFPLVWICMMLLLLLLYPIAKVVYSKIKYYTNL